jgi:serine/threonine protein kinase
VERLEDFHAVGLVHGDIKNDNILLGSNNISSKENRILYLIDFGISSKYRNENGDHIKKELKK